jgi:hypothetical protein
VRAIPTADARGAALSGADLATGSDVEWVRVDRTAMEGTLRRTIKPARCNIPITLSTSVIVAVVMLLTRLHYILSHR